MEFLVLLVILFLVAPYVIGGWAHMRAARLEKLAADLRGQIRDLQTASATREEELDLLRRQLDSLRTGSAFPEARAAETPETISETSTAPSLSEPVEPSTPAQTGEPSRAFWRGWRPWPKGGLERQFGAILPVWIGAIAIAFAGFFLVKYSIENELIGPQARVTLGAVLGLALLGAARWVSARSAADLNHRIAQALAGAGLAVLYVSIYAATALYGLVSGFLGFAGMAATTAAAVILAIRHGPAIALLGMVGGFLTPALMSSDEPSAFAFFAYLYFVFAALMTVIRREGWWWLSWPAVLFAFAWALLWIVSGSAAEGESVWLGLFLAAVAGTIVYASRDRYAEEVNALATWRDLLSWRNLTLALNVASIAGAMALMAFLAFNSSFGLTEWGLFAILAVGAVALAFFDPQRYGFAPWVAMAVNAVMLAGWSPDGDGILSAMLAAFGALYVASGFLLLPGATAPILWAALSAATAIGYFLIGFFRLTPERPAEPQRLPLDIAPSREPVEPLVEGIRETAAAVPHVWAVLAMGLALLFLGAALWAARRLPQGFAKERILAIYALATSAFVALALFIELDRAFLSVAIAAELLAVAWVASRTRIDTLRPIAMLLGAVFAFLLIPQILLLLQLSVYSIAGIEWHVQESIPIVDFPTFQLALPAALFILAAYILRRASDGFFIRLLELSALALIALWGFYTTANLFHPDENVLFAKASFLERGVITNVLFVYGLACLMIARIFGRIAFFQGGVLLVAVALFRIVYFDLLTKNPVWVGGEVAGVAPVDALTLTFALPILWSWLAVREIRRQAEASWLQWLAQGVSALPLLFAFAWISLEIRKLFHGTDLAAGYTSDAEFYSYSAAWLAFGLALLFYGTLRGSQLMRYASLVVMLVTVTKVFLLDAGSLTGLYRVFSFLGLGLSLIGISYFYGRFVFHRDGGDSDPPASTARPEGSA